MRHPRQLALRLHLDESGLVHYVLAPPRNGKGVYCMKLVLEEFVFTERQVVVAESAAIKPFALQELLDKRASREIDVEHRFTELPNDQVWSFWRHRGWRLVDGVWQQIIWEPKTVRVPDDNGVIHERIEWPVDLDDKGVFYYIPEIADYFDKEDYKLVSREAESYFRYHGKLGDDVLFDTQAFEQVAKPLRIKAQDFTYVSNLRNRKIFGFRGPLSFTRVTFARPVDAGSNQTPIEGPRPFFLDKELSDCYDTAKGVGIHGRGDQAVWRSGFNWKFGVAALLVLVAAGTFAPKLLSMGIRRVVLGPSRPVPAAAVPAGEVATAAPGPGGEGQAVRLASPPGAAAPVPVTNFPTMAPAPPVVPPTVGVLQAATVRQVDGVQVASFLIDGEWVDNPPRSIYRGGVLYWKGRIYKPARGKEVKQNEDSQSHPEVRRAGGYGGVGGGG